MTKRRAFYFDGFGPVWAASPAAARGRLKSFSRIPVADITEMPSADVPEYLHRDEGLLAIGKPVFQGTRGR